MLPAGHRRIRSTRPLLAGRRTTQPRLRESEVVADGVYRAFSDLGRFLRRQTSEVAQLNRLGQDGILSSKLVEGAIQFEQRQEILAISSPLQSNCLDAIKVAASFSGRSLARVINQDPPHHLGFDRQKMSLVGDIRRGGAKHSNVDFIDQRRGLQRVVFPLFSKILPGNGAKLSVDQRHQFLGCLGIAFPHTPQQLRDLGIHDRPSIGSIPWLGREPPPGNLMALFPSGGSLELSRVPPQQT
jgi:hypothetical protein